ncbi:MAG: rhodanese-like domain-containing protein [bacterium]|nr:rhodanese-like domain-containing protein [bacterium]
MFKEIAPAEAHRLLTAGEVGAYIDVRTVEEFAAGHPEGAVNVPVAVPDPASGQMMLNDQFLAVVQANFQRTDPMVVGCQMGGRSTKAAQMLTEAGFEQVHNMRGGFAGARDATGQVIEPGWQAGGYPVQNGAPEGRCYHSMRASRS